MGDRANVVIVSRAYDSEVWLYTHSRGRSVEQLAADGLRKAVDGGRGDDPAYLGRIVAQHFFNAHGDGATGAGLTSCVTDGESHVVRIDVDRQTVSYDPEGNEYGGEHVEVSFADYLAAFPVLA